MSTHESSSNPLSEPHARAAQDLQWLLLDVDGVLTDGRLWYSADGEGMKAFHVRDGLAIGLARRSGMRVGLLSGKSSLPLERRAADLRLDNILLGSKDKGKDFTTFLAQVRTRAENVAYIGDDLIDLPVLHRCGLSFCPADAVPEVRQVADRTLSTPGGRGVVREMVELILRAQGKWSEIVDSYLPRSP